MFQTWIWQGLVAEQFQEELMVPTGEHDPGPVRVLMVPLRRCGSHAIRLRLSGSPELYSPYPLHITDFMHLVPLYGDLSDDRAYFQMITDVIGLQAATMVKWPGVALDPVVVFEALAEQPRSVHAVPWEMLRQAGEMHNASVLMDKSLDSVHYAAEQLAVHPQMRFLNVVRDPRAQVNSMSRAIIHDFDTTLNALTWVRAYDAAAELSERCPGQVLTVRYEDFVADPESQLKLICGFLGVEFTEGMLRGGESAEARALARRSALWVNNSSLLEPAYNGMYLQTMDRREIEIVETLAAGHMKRYGYQAHTPAGVELCEQELADARERSETGRQEAWERLRSQNPQDYQLRKYRAWYLDAVRQRLLIRR
ncbi:hypothetical protein ABIE67_009724 [Streptomyces sp. V4I8]|uniref:sulfotransferase family protein n=1 Tax=Streptomyces sp. V4I8 TaxID=3156469 RepID=UPI003518A1B9